MAVVNQDDELFNNVKLIKKADGTQKLVYGIPNAPEFEWEEIAIAGSIEYEIPIAPDGLTGNADVLKINLWKDRTMTFNYGKSLVLTIFSADAIEAKFELQKIYNASDNYVLKPLNIQDIDFDFQSKIEINKITGFPYVFSAKPFIRWFAWISNHYLYITRSSYNSPHTTVLKSTEKLEVEYLTNVSPAELYVGANEIRLIEDNVVRTVTIDADVITDYQGNVSIGNSENNNIETEFGTKSVTLLGSLGIRYASQIYGMSSVIRDMNQDVFGNLGSRTSLAVNGDLDFQPNTAHGGQYDMVPTKSYNNRTSTVVSQDVFGYCGSIAQRDALPKDKLRNSVRFIETATRSDGSYYEFFDALDRSQSTTYPIWRYERMSNEGGAWYQDGIYVGVDGDKWASLSSGYHYETKILRANRSSVDNSELATMYWDSIPFSDYNGNLHNTTFINDFNVIKTQLHLLQTGRSRADGYYQYDTLFLRLLTDKPETALRIQIAITYKPYKNGD